MSQTGLPAEDFEKNRTRLRAVAYRMLGSLTEADDAVQEAWLRVSRPDAHGTDDLDTWLTMVVLRVCRNVLHTRHGRRDEPPRGAHEALLADSAGLALCVVLATLTPAERLAFVLHDVFDVPFEDIGPMVGLSPVTARQLAGRVRSGLRRAGGLGGGDDFGQGGVQAT